MLVGQVIGAFFPAHKILFQKTDSMYGGVKGVAGGPERGLSARGRVRIPAKTGGGGEGRSLLDPLQGWGERLSYMYRGKMRGRRRRR